MRSWMGVIIVLSLWPGLHAFSQAKKADATAVDPDLLSDVRKSLQSRMYGDHVDKLTAKGAALNNVYLAILRDESAFPVEADRIFNLVAKQKDIDRRAFLTFADKGLGHETSGVRQSAAHLLGKIGSANEASLLVPLLSDDDVGVQYDAAEALANIGTGDEIKAFDQRLAAKHPKNFPELFDHFKKCRDRLKKRLDEAKKKE